MLVALYTVAIFLSALLLFLVQPMFARMMLPKLGGSPYVWNTALVFYQGALLLGYLYAHLSTRYLGVRKQGWLHIVVLLSPLLLLPIALRAGEPPAASSPVPWLLFTMLVSIGLPFFVVSATSPILQRWFSATGHKDARDPYFLYGWSNFGSMAALLLYPTVVEPRLVLGAQSHAWSIGYCALIVFMVLCAVGMWRGPRTAAVEEAQPDEGDEPRLERPTSMRRLRWVALAFVPSSLMIGVTTYLSTDVASVPLLWVFPLAVYLLSFMIVFRRKPLIPHIVMVWLLPWVVVATLLVFVGGIVRPALPLGLLGMATLFVVAMVFHGELARDRPSVRHLTEFYLLTSLGGVLGGMFAALLAPAIFVLVIEYSLTLVLAGFLMPRRPSPAICGSRVLDVMAPLLALVTAAALTVGFVPSPGDLKLAAAMLLPAGIALVSQWHPIRFGICLLAILVVGTYRLASAPYVVMRDRSFYGTLTVYDREIGGYWYHEMLHGTTIHGRQKLDPATRDIPVSYYFRTGPIGQLFETFQYGPGTHVAVVGLGSGSLAGYGRAGQNWTFYDIDPRVERVATNPKYFTFVPDCLAKVKIVLGDARLSLQKSTDMYDLMVLDAYSSDAVPVHLMTQQALDLYMSHMRPHGIVVFHVSNQHLILAPIVAQLAQSRGLIALRRNDNPISDDEWELGKLPSEWILVARDRSDFRSLAKDQEWSPPEIWPHLRLWTDDYSNVFQVLRIR